MIKLDYYICVGYALELLSKSPYHLQHDIGEYFRTEVLPAIWNNQIRFYVTDAGIPTAMLTWAWLSEEVEAELHETGRSLSREEWKCGDRLFINDLAAPYENSREVIKDIKNNFFADHCVTSLRRNMDGSVRRVNRWIGANVARNQQRSAVA